MMPPKPRFQEGEKVLCFHGPLIYEAKCLKVQVKDKQVKFCIHYAGWNKNWDEWVPESRILKLNEANLQKQKELQKAHVAQLSNVKTTKKAKVKAEKDKLSGGEAEEENDPKKNRRGTKRKSETPSKTEGKSETPAADRGSKKSGSTTSAASPASSGPATTSDTESKRKRGRPEPGVETEEQFMTKLEVRIKIPDELKPWLVDDWDLITRQRKLYNLPARVTVNEIIQDYVKMKTSSKCNTPNKESAVLEVTNGIKEYFNVMLGSQLLYKFERSQYAEVLQKHVDQPMAGLYGPIHLLRLFVKLGPVLTYTQLDEKSIQLLQLHVQDLLRYMQRKSEHLFTVQDYSVASPEYHRKAM